MLRFCLESIRQIQSWKTMNLRSDIETGAIRKLRLAGKGISQIALELGCSEGMVQRRLVRAGLGGREYDVRVRKRRESRTVETQIVIHDVDQALWLRVRDRAKTEGKTVREKFIELLEGYLRV